MARQIKDECCGCDIPCEGLSCPRRSVLHIMCDRCADEDEQIYCIDGYDLCEDCLIKYLLATGMVEEA